MFCYKVYKKLIFLLPTLVLFFGCASMNQQADSELRGELAQLQVANKNLEAKQIDLYSKYDKNSTAVDTLMNSVQELTKQISSLKQKIQDLEIVQKNNQNNINAQSSVSEQVSPSEIFNNAYNDFLVGRYELAEMGFRTFLKKYPEHVLAVQAQYYIGESLYSRSNWTDAYEEYKKVESSYQNSEFIPSARLKMALCLELLGKKNETIIVLKSILQDFPKSAEAFTAKEKLKVYAK